MRHQLKKYVGAVQLLRRDGNSGTRGTETSTNRPPVSFRDYHDEAEAYESKLIQVKLFHFFKFS